MMVHLHYELSLVAGSVAVALFVCYLAISIEQLLFKGLRKELEKIVLLGSGATLGAAIWCMHFMGMLACDFPAPYSFDYPLTILSYFIAFVASTFAIWLNNRPSLSFVRLVLGSFLMGLAITGMHYTGMMGLIVEGYKPRYNVLLVLCSIFIAVSGTGLTFWLSFKYKNNIKRKLLFKAAIALMMALSIIGMHYTGMAAVRWDIGDHALFEGLIASEQGILIFSVIFVTSLILMAAFVVAIMDQRLEERSRQLFKLNQELANQALQDSLTKLPNRSFLTEYADTLFSHHEYHHDKLAFIYIDLDQFKTVNDGFGHHVGDQLLVQLTARIHRKLSNNEKLLRIGGDEFLLIIERATLEHTVDLAEQILLTIQERFLIAWKEIHISASMGIAMYPEHGQNLQDLLMNADAAMLTSKFQGRNTYSIYNYCVHQEEIKSQSRLVNELYKAVEEQQFVLFYQPKFTCSDYQVCGVEALIRWQHPQLGLLGPNLFIRGAEQTGLIIQMGYWVIEEALKQIQIWEQLGRHYFPIAVNLSAIQFEHKNLFSTLEQLFEKYPINPAHLMLEVTESTAMHHIDTTIETFCRLRSMGIQLSIDDFGTGHSSFLYLKNLPVNELKIDRAFILDLKANSKEEMILESIIRLAVQLGLIVTVEGVEHQEQADILRRLGSQQLQGYLLGMPMPIEELEQMSLPKLHV